ncbi:F-box domain-containing protein [Sporormia fimetaria CBS 119925]|uniref:F-box domain-containing protein n=1 Tax=Sporormia fimetaria CBS 119925 TaxID=1340428 RepID=A0A6A6V0M9_9PLEO|nr:F-box domain-containing protein [Sporormia fimetaria CBS 119925]
MGFMKRFRRHKTPKQEKGVLQRDFSFPQNYNGPDRTAGLDDKILRRIFEYVCPHCADETLNSSEESGGDGCMSCDMRDLAHCALTKRQWYSVAAGLLYNSIRIDAVHYCDLEEVYAEQRRRKSRNGDDFDPPTTRLLQLCRTVRDNHYLGQRVRFLKLPYMTREACKADLARTVSVCPNLEYVDLPEGFYTGDTTCHALRQELQARCPHIRKMKFNEGSELMIESLLQGHFQELRVIEINRLQIEPTILRRVLGNLPWLSEITFSNTPWLNDSVFHSVPGIPDFPALDTLRFIKVTNLTAQGLEQYLSNSLCRDILRSMYIKECPSLPVSTLHIILHAATSLHTLEYTSTISTSLPMGTPLPPLASNSLHTLRYEITSNTTNQIHSLPNLTKLYVRDPDFPESLAMAPPIRPFASSSSPPPQTFSQPLEVFSKGMHDLEWIFTSIIPPDAYTGRRGSLSGGRPVSSYSAHKGLGPQWGGDARKSIVVPNGFGGFLAVPAENERPRSAGNPGPNGGGGHSHSLSNGSVRSFMGFAGRERERRSSRADLWR